MWRESRIVVSVDPGSRIDAFVLRPHVLRSRRSEFRYSFFEILSVCMCGGSAGGDTGERRVGACGGRDAIAIGTRV